ncbi:MAG TPA: hypothetical protein VHU14_08310 [Solirubrobacterales bacterium]|jgi:hypothetical protein|nr:hypothetical protein [Solirubrobacterales bacterium]
MDDEREIRPPRGALIVIAIGLLACIAAALLATDQASGEAADLEWVQKVSMADSRPAPLPGGNAMQLIGGSIQTTGVNVSGYSLFRVSSRLRIDAGTPVGGGRVLCSVSGAGQAEIAQSAGGLRATYPRSTTGLFNQEVSETILLDFSSHGTELAVLELDGLPPHFSTEKGVKLEWAQYQPGVEHLEYFLPAGKPKQELLLPFDTVWRTTSAPGAKVACTLTTSAGRATVRTGLMLKKVPPPIDEEAEEENRERAEEEVEEKEG